jgi:hypothetical protein
MSRARVHTVDASTILSDAAILQRVFSFLPGNWLYLGGVCRDWMLCYKHLPDSDIFFKDAFQRTKKADCGWRTTLMRAVVQSPSRLRLAVHCGLQLGAHDKGRLPYIAGRYADQATLLLAQELGMSLSANVVRGAASSGRVSVFNYLVQDRYCAVPYGVDFHAAQCGDVDMLKCLKENGCQFTDDTCRAAATAGQLSSFQYILNTRLSNCELSPFASC